MCTTMPKLSVYLDEEDIDYIDSVGKLIGAKSRSEAIRFCIKLLRLILPRANLISKIVLRYLEEVNSR